MRDYEEPVIAVVHLDANDIVCTSGCGAGGDDTQNLCLTKQ